jgi:7-cyano-7-deazaguanine synthase
VLGASEIFIGVNAVDYSGYPDCRPEYVAAYERMANLATRGAVEGTTPVHIRAPLLDLTKPEIINLGLELGVDYGMTSSCYDPGPHGEACGRCDACRLRLDAFARLGRKDPARYA